MKGKIKSRLNREENSIMVKKNIVSYFPAHEYDGIDDLAETITNPANCCSLTMIHFIKTILSLLTMNPYTFTKILSNRI